MGSNKITPLPFVLLFDLDGTIIDSEHATISSVRDSYASCGVTVSQGDLESCVGKSWNSIFSYLSQRYPLSGDVSVAQVEEKVIQSFNRLTRERVQPLPGVVATIRELSQQYRLAVVSGSTHEQVHHALSALGILSCFELLLGQEDYEHSKPSPSGYLKAMSLMQVDAADCIVFEDSIPGMLSARQAGVSGVIQVVGPSSYVSGHSHHDRSLSDAQIIRFEKLAVADHVRQLLTKNAGASL